MLKVSTIVREIVLDSEPDQTALSRGVLNLTAYAKLIQADVERRTFKPVKLGSIVVALSRLAQEMHSEPRLLPDIHLDSLSVKSNLAEIAFSKTSENKARAQKLYGDKNFAQADFLTVTYGVGEISLFVPMGLVKSALMAFKPEKPKLVLDNLAALTVQFGEHYIDTPNMYYALLQRLAVRKINIVEVVSTFTELTLLVHQKELNSLFLLMNALTRRAGGGR